jgi:hypothetical protein
MTRTRFTNSPAVAIQLQNFQNLLSVPLSSAKVGGQVKKKHFWKHLFFSNTHSDNAYYVLTIEM